MPREVNILKPTQQVDWLWCHVPEPAAAEHFFPPHSLFFPIIVSILL